MAAVAVAAMRSSTLMLAVHVPLCNRPSECVTWGLTQTRQIPSRRSYKPGESTESRLRDRGAGVEGLGVEGFGF